MFSLGQKMNDFFGISEIESCYSLLMLTNHCIRKDFIIKLRFDLYGIFFFQFSLPFLYFSVLVFLLFVSELFIRSQIEF